MLSGVYYVTGEDEGQEAPPPPRLNGSTEFIDPRYSLRTHVPPAQFAPQCQDLGGGCDLGGGSDGSGGDRDGGEHPTRHR